MIRIAEFKSRFGAISILRVKRTGALVYCQGGCFQSEADAHGTSLASYIHAIYGLLHQAKTQDILLIGCGGGTLATMLFNNSRDVTVVDINPQAFLLARKYFGMPSGVACRVADGSEFLLSDSYTYDAIVLDAFAGDMIPAHVRSEAFFRLAHKRLDPGGCIFVNVHVTHDYDPAPDRISTCMARVWPDVRLLDAEGYRNRNAIVMAGAVSRLKKPELHLRPLVCVEDIDVELETMDFRAWRTLDGIISPAS